MPPMNNSVAPFALIARWLLLAILFVMPWLHGAERSWEQLVVAGCILVATVLMLSDKRALSALPTGTLLIVLLFGIWLLYSLVYLVPLPLSWMASISPNTYAWYSQNTTQNTGYLSLYRQASLVELFKYAGLVALFLLISRLFKTADRIRGLCRAVVTIGSVTAVYSLINFVTGGAMEWVSAIPPWDLSWHKGIRGTFSYKNQYAMYMVICILLTSGLLFDHQRTVGYKRLTSKGVFYLACLILLVATVLNTSSRGALVSLFAGSVAVTVLYLVRQPMLLKRWLKPKILALITVFTILLAVAFSQSAVYQRFSEQKMEDNGRALLRSTVVEVINDYPAFGTGPGTYPFIQHNYKPIELGNTQMSKRAHNDYLETVATQGALGFMLLAVPIGLMMIRLFRQYSDSPLTGLLLACQASVIAYLVQAAIDVNIGVYLLPVHFIVVLSAGWVIGHILGQQVPANNSLEL